MYIVIYVDVKIYFSGNFLIQYIIALGGCSDIINHEAQGRMVCKCDQNLKMAIYDYITHATYYIFLYYILTSSWLLSSKCS